jgi:hypothetical protein
MICTLFRKLIFLLFSSVFQFRWLNIDVTLLVLWYLFATYGAALLCTLSILSMCCLVWGAQIEEQYSFNYTLKGHVLESINTAKYLGITLSSNMSWDTHINNITAKANKILWYCIPHVDPQSASLFKSICRVTQSWWFSIVRYKKLFYDELHSFSTFFALNFDKKLAVE